MFSILNPIKFNTKDQRIWFTSDCHFNHDQDFIYNRRYGLDNREDYTEYLISLWNLHISPDDVVFDLGDFIFQDGIGTKAFSILSKLNGQHYLLWGNHNSGIKTVFKDQVHYPYTILDKVHYLGHYAEIVVDKQPIVLCHYPIVSWNDMVHGTWMLHGHSHGSFPDTDFGRIQDVGLDVFPEFVTFEQLQSVMEKREVTYIDLHNQDTNPSRSWS
jgi:calcineurin-like phosphoesterase family protein